MAGPTRRVIVAGIHGAPNERSAIAGVDVDSEHVRRGDGACSDGGARAGGDDGRATLVIPIDRHDDYVDLACG